MAFTGYPVTDLKRARNFYENVLGLQPAHTFGDEKTGVQIIVKALEEPTRQIAINAGLEGSVIVDKVKNSAVGIGFDENLLLFFA